MKLARGLVSFALILSLSILSFVAVPFTAIAQDSTVTLQRGYRTGYSDGYMAGYRDSIDSAAKDFTRHNEYKDASRAFNKDYGALEDYRDGYQQGFEAGYDTGFEKRSFDGAIPTDLKRRGVKDGQSVAEDPPPAADDVAEAPATAAPDTNTTQLISFRPQSDATIIIPRETELIVELLEPISTDKNKEGDKFTARVVSPTEITGAVLEGRIAKVQKPGRIKKRSMLLLSFDRIVLSESRWSNFNAIVTEVLPLKGDNVRRVDTEGTAVGKSTVKRDSTVVGGAAGSGAVIGAIAGGPVGAAVGAGIGAAVGVGAVVIERGKHIKLGQNQQLRIKSSYETQIR